MFSPDIKLLTLLLSGSNHILITILKGTLIHNMSSQDSLAAGLEAHGVKSSLDAEMDDTVSMDDARLGDMLLDNAGLSPDQKLLITTTTNMSTEFDAIAEALKVQHSRIHVT